MHKSPLFGARIFFWLGGDEQWAAGSGASRWWRSFVSVRHGDFMLMLVVVLWRFWSLWRLVDGFMDKTLKYY